EIAHSAGVAASDWSWGALIFDADNDGLNDIYISNGIYNDVTDQDFIDFFANDVIQKMVLTGKKEEIEEIIKKMPSVPLQNKMYRNNGNLTFNDMATPWGLSDKTFSNGAAYGDLDNDGDLDLIVSNVNQPALIYKNNSRALNKNHFLKLRLSGLEKNTQAIGSMVKVYSDSLVLMRELLPSRGFQSSVDYTLQFGLGTKTKVDSMVITWPDRTFTRVLSPGIDTLLRIAQRNTSPANALNERSTALFENQPNNFEKHTEDDFVDFYTERNIPQMLSKEGPAAAVADINKDGLEDIYISGSLKKAGQFYLQTTKGFIKHNGFKETLPPLEITATLFFDADADGDADLFLGAGGNHQPSYGTQMQNRLYLNDGKGNFSRSNDPLPKNMGNTSVLLPHDIDGDGDLDLFAASRSMPSNYGVTPKSVFYINDGKGVFKLLPLAQAGPLTEAGMITGAVWINLDNDTQKELMVVGDWMAPRTFKFSGNRFIEFKTNLSAKPGWWQSVAAADLDGDGDDDLVLGNLGDNFYLRPDVKQPVKLWINAFSKSMLPEKIITRSINNKDVPVFLKRDLTDQIPTLKKQNLRHGEYANKSIQELFDETLIKTSKVKEVNYTRSCVAWNEGTGKFTISELPYPLQLSSVNAILVTDVNNDRHPDILLGGNLLDWLPQFSRVDGSFGNLLLNLGSRKWDCVTPEKSGIDIDGAVKHIMPIKVQGNQQYIFLRNSEVPVVYSLKAP
ncbi:MAG: FG-GAP-like repeat-containing protein, partial [Chitinophagaceae bacterium]